MHISNIIEALIFAADAPLKPAQMLEILSKETFEEGPLTPEALEGILAGLTEKYASEDFPFELRGIDGGFQFFTKRAYFQYVRHAAVVASKKKLSRSSLETLAIIAYRQPVTKPEIEYIRGVNCDHAIQKLLEKKLVEIRGRADAPGKPLVYGTSAFFMEYFGLNNLADLPKLQDFPIDEDEYKKQFETYLAEQEMTASDEAAAFPKEEAPTEEVTAENEAALNPSDDEDSVQVHIKPEGEQGEEE